MTAIDARTEVGPRQQDASAFNATAQRAEFMQVGRGRVGIDSAVVAAQVFIDSRTLKGPDHSSHVEVYNASYHMREHKGFGVQNKAMLRNSEGWASSATGNEQLTLEL